MFKQTVLADVSSTTDQALQLEALRSVVPEVGFKLSICWELFAAQKANIADELHANLSDQLVPRFIIQFGVVHLC